jgi:arylsulfatase A
MMRHKINRRGFLQLVGAFGASSVLSGCLPSAMQKPKVSRPNIVVILADDMGYGELQCLNPKRGKIKTPQLDSIAKGGMIFTDGHSGSAVCTPTRYGLMTGRYA